MFCNYQDIYDSHQPFSCPKSTFDIGPQTSTYGKCGTVEASFQVQGESPVGGSEFHSCRDTLGEPGAFRLAGHWLERGGGLGDSEIWCCLKGKEGEAV